jgi:type IV secretion system protein VirD4
MLLDEFANVGVIPHFETTISVARGRGVSLWLGIQSLSQLSARYGKENAQTILTNCGTKIALHGLDAETGKYISETLGEATVKSQRRSSTRLFGMLPSATVTVSDQENRRFLLTADEVRRIGTDQVIAVVGNLRPMLLTKRVYREPEREKAWCTGLGAAWAVMPLERIAAAPPPLPDGLRTRLLLPESSE